jgi:hypothetical protein
MKTWFDPKWSEKELLSSNLSNLRIIINQKIKIGILSSNYGIISNVIDIYGVFLYFKYRKVYKETIMDA